MIAHLRGRLLEKQPNRVIVDVNGVGYDVHVPLSTFFDMAEPGAEIALRIHTHVREDALLLYGFGTVLELQIFERLISVSGIGPKLALAVLSGIEPAELVSAIRTANVPRLTGIPGIGKKIAERIGLEDRKSTRLNSSHLVISYAVFCLKKKKTTRRQLEKPARIDEEVLRITVEVQETVEGLRGTICKRRQK